jgi:hypothetical protein
MKPSEAQQIRSRLLKSSIFANVGTQRFAEALLHAPVMWKRLHPMDPRM